MARPESPAVMFFAPLHDKIAPSQPCPAVKAYVASPYRVGRQHGECPSRTWRPYQARQTGEHAIPVSWRK
jgi:hypothetical protein